MNIIRAKELLAPHIACAKHPDLGNLYHFVHDKWLIDHNALFYWAKHHPSTQFYEHNGWGTGRVFVPNQSPELNEAIALYEAFVLGPEYYAAK